MADDDVNKVVNVSGAIVIFGFVSSVFLFISMLILGGINNYLLGGLLGIFEFMAGLGIIDSSFVDIAVDSADNYIGLMNYLDYIFLGALLTLVIGSLVFSYNRPRLNYFSMFASATFGLIVFIFIGGIVLDLTTWFQTEVMLKVFPTLANVTPIFSWYLDNMAIINLILIVLNLIATYVDFNFERFNRKSNDDSNLGGGLGEI